MKRLLICFAVSLLGLQMAVAQVAKQVEVEKNYTPSVNAAQKLAIIPDMTDTVMMRPEVDYAFMPRSYETSLLTPNFKPATIAYWDYMRSPLLYVKAASGVPLNSEADVYVSTYRKEKGYAMAYVNHKGDYQSRYLLDGVTKVRDNTSEMSNRVGARAGLFVGRRMLEVDVYADEQLRHRYPTTGERILFGDLDGKLRFGDDFSNMERWNFNVEFGGGLYANAAKLESGQRLGLANMAAQAKVGKKQFKVQFGYDGTFGRNALEEYKNNIFNAGVRFGLGRERLDFVLGADYYFDKVSNLTDSPHKFSPYMRMMWKNSSEKFVPYIEVNGDMKHNDIAAMTYANPYVVVSLDALEKLVSMPNEMTYNARAGFKGNLGRGIFAYGISAEFTSAGDHIYWCSQGADYTFVTAYQHSLRLNGNMVFRPSGWFMAQIEAGAYVWENYDGFYSNRPNFDIDVELRYTGRRFSAGVEMECDSAIKWMTLVERETEEGVVPAYGYIQTHPTIMVNLDAQWRINERWAVFAQGRNLTGGKLYDWLHYYRHSPQCVVGVKFGF